MTSIRRDLTRGVLGLTLLLVAGGLLALWFGAGHAATEQFDATLRAKAAAISTSARGTVDGPRFEFTDRFFQGFEDYEARDFFAVADATGRVLVHSESLRDPAQAIFRPGTPERPAVWNLTLPTGRRGRAVAYTFRPRAVRPLVRGQTPVLELFVASDRSELDRDIGKLLAFALLWSALLAGLVLWLVPRLLSRSLRPLDQVARQAAGIDAGSLATRFRTEELPAELRPIGRSLNELLGRLEASFARERRFSADLAHELRTPLAELKTMLEAAIKWPDSRDPETDAEALAAVRDMERLVGHLLALTRIEQGQAQIVREEVAVDEVAERVWRRFAATAAERRLQLDWSAAACTAAADPGLLAAVLGNLFENAAEYALAGSTVNVSIGLLGGGAAGMTVTNAAPDLDAGDIAHLFDRFWRKEAARNTGGSHVGLGLSLARSFAEAMGWSLRADQPEPGVLRFTLRAQLKSN